MKLLVANRGEIAVRVIRACRELGIKTVAVYSQADANALHTLMADEAYYLGPPTPVESYLKIAKIIEIARKTGCKAIHPGYGFLAENPEFARACENENLIFVGPSSVTMELIGHKITAKIIASQCGIPVIPGELERVETIERAKEIASQIGYPVLLKAAAGGGGKGMRVVTSEEEMDRAFREARAEARSAFADPTIFIEKFIKDPRHVEIQVLADKYGNVIYLGERECSIQRRHQKLVEEAPCVVIDQKMRQEMGECAIKLAKETNYTIAGTFEFVLDHNRRFYFLEVNARVQVEHPVTEMVTGVDIVREQILLALGEKLTIKQEDIKLNGHAIECRIMAEDPLTNFTPSSGKILEFLLPSGPFVRIDSGYRVGDQITYFYDSLIAKLIVWAETRDMVISRALRALREMRITGVKTTIPFYIALLQNEKFIKGDIHTNFIKSEPLDIYEKTDLEKIAALAAVIYAKNSERNFLQPQPSNYMSAWKRAFRESIR